MNANDVLELMLRIVGQHAALIVSDGLLLAGIFMLACRIEKMMRGVTELRVFVQHFALACSLGAALLLSFGDHSDWGPACVAGGVVFFFLMSLKRWRQAPPQGTKRARPVADHELRHVAGGRSER